LYFVCIISELNNEGVKYGLLPTSAAALLSMNNPIWWRNGQNSIDSAGVVQ